MVYKKSLCDNVRRYFYSFVGYWERRAAEIEKGLAGEDAENVAKRTAAYSGLLAEMNGRERLRGLPSLEKWARRIRVHPSTVSRWRTEHPEFDEACRDCLLIQKDLLRDGGLSGVYGSSTVNFLLKMQEEREARELGQESGGLRFEDFEDA